MGLADSRMKNLLIALLRFAVVTAKLCGLNHVIVLEGSMRSGIT